MGDESSVELSIPGFDIKRAIGRGGMATVYLAVQHDPNRVVALKVLDNTDVPVDEQDQRATLVDRFRQEGELVAAMHHPNIVDVYGIGTTDRDVYIAMEFVGGNDLASRIEAGVHPFEALDIMTPIADALGYAHRRNVIHRDVKPNNVLFRRDGTPLLSDFGIAKQLNTPTQLTMTGMLVGSPVYMSPEQIEGRVIDGRSDLYSLGIILYEMLTGRPPFFSNSPLRVMLMHSNEPVPELPSDLAGLQPLCNRLLAKERDQRFDTAEDLAAELRRLRAELARRSEQTLAQKLASAAPLPLSETGELTVHFTNGLLESIAQDRVILPTPGSLAHRMRKLLERGVLPPENTVALVRMDPSICVQVMRLANGAFYGESRNVDTVADAVRVLGSHASSQIAALLEQSEAVESALSDNAREYLHSAWVRARVVAIIAREIGRRAGVGAERAELAGLLHNVGALATVGWSVNVARVLGSPGRLERAASKAQGEVSRRLVADWLLPEALLPVVASETNSYVAASIEPTVADVVGLAKRIERANPEDVEALEASPTSQTLGFDRARLAMLIERSHAERDRLTPLLDDEGPS